MSNRPFLGLSLWLKIPIIKTKTFVFSCGVFVSIVLFVIKAWVGIIPSCE